MPTAQLRHPYTLAELIAAAEYRNSPDTRGSFEYADLFAAPNAPIAADTVCLPDEPLDEGTFDEDDNPEGYSDFVFDNNLELLYYGQQFADAHPAPEKRRDNRRHPPQPRPLPETRHLSGFLGRLKTKPDAAQPQP